MSHRGGTDDFGSGFWCDLMFRYLPFDQWLVDLVPSALRRSTSLLGSALQSIKVYIRDDYPSGFG